MFPITQNQNLKRVQYLVKAFMYAVQNSKLDAFRCFVSIILRFHISHPLSPRLLDLTLVLACARVLVCARRQSKGSFFGHEPGLSYV